MTEEIILEYIHTLPGRLRVQVREVKGSAEKAALAEAALQALAGVHEVTANQLTGNVLVLYDQQQTSAGALVSVLRSEGLLMNRPQPERRKRKRRRRHTAPFKRRIAEELALSACGELLKFSIRTAIVALV